MTPSTETRDSAVPEGVGSGAPGSALSRLAGALGPGSGLVIVVIGLIAFFTWRSPYFLTYENALVIGDVMVTVGIVAIGATLVIVSGGIDLSVGSVVALAATLMGVLFDRMGIPLPLAIVAGLAAGALVGLVNGLLVTLGGLAPFIATLATMSAVRGIALMLTNGVQVADFPSWFDQLATQRYAGISALVGVLILVCVVGHIYLGHRPGGRETLAVGGNETVARLAGISITRTKIRTYVIAGLLAGLAGIALSSRLDSATPNFGVGLELQVIAAVVIGGASLSGGIGSVPGTALGVLVVAVLANGLNLIGVSSFAQQVVIGVVIAGAVMVDSYRRRRAT